MFVGTNATAFQLTSHFLLITLQAKKELDELKPIFPCKEKREEAEFRKIIVNYLKSLEKVGFVQGLA